MPSPQVQTGKSTTAPFDTNNVRKDEIKHNPYDPYTPQSYQRSGILNMRGLHMSLEMEFSIKNPPN